MIYFYKLFLRNPFIGGHWNFFDKGGIILSMIKQVRSNFVYAKVQVFVSEYVVSVFGCHIVRLQALADHLEEYCAVGRNCDINAAFN